jgi:putative ABC transport system substrate-binding protein
MYLLAAWHRGLAEGGFVEGQNVAIEFRWARGQYGLLTNLATDLVNRHVAVLAAVGGEPAALAAKRATSTIPIVFSTGSDPISIGLVESFNRPGGNATGITMMTTAMGPKRFALLRELVPGSTVVGFLLNPRFPQSVRQLQDFEEAARISGHRFVVAKAGTVAEIDSAFATLTKERADALLMAADPFFDTRREQILALAQRYRLPAIYQFREYALAGGLMSYGVDIADVYRQNGVYIAQVLKGAKPAELPVLQPAKFELVINLKTAKALGVKISDNLLSLADEVID